MTNGNLTANGSVGPVSSGKGKAHIVASGSFGGGTLTLEVSPDGGTTWVATTSTLTAAGVIVAEVPSFAAARVRATLGSSTTPNLNVWLDA